jgi:glycerate 2-kinase
MIDPTAHPTLRLAAQRCFDAAIAAVNPRRLVAQSLRRDGGGLVLDAPSGLRSHRGPVVLVAAGKAALAMAHAAADVADPAGGVIIVPHGMVTAGPPGLAVLPGAHPVPDAAGAEATRHLVATVDAADGGVLVVALLSGGASALLVAPAGDLTLADKQEVTAGLLASGADIAALNTVRKHCSRVKGGGLLRTARSAAGIWTLVLSDVIGDDPATIASGPTVADPTTFADALAVLDRWLDPAVVPPRVRAHLEAGRDGRRTETVKPGDPALARSVTHVLAGNRTAVVAAADAARGLGYEPHVPDEALRGDAADAGRAIATRLASLPRDRPVALVAGGETTVRVVRGGCGGRSQHLALASALALAGHPGTVLAAGTDGVDGPTDAAGACIDGDTVDRARRRGLDPEAALATTRSHPLLAATGDLVRTGPTGTNVADLVVALRPAC